MSFPRPPLNTWKWPTLSCYWNVHWVVLFFYFFFLNQTIIYLGMSLSPFCLTIFYPTTSLSRLATPPSGKSHLHSVSLISHTCIQSPHQPQYLSLSSTGPLLFTLCETVQCPPLEFCLTCCRPRWPSTVPRLSRPGALTYPSLLTTPPRPAGLCILYSSLFPSLLC